MFLYEYGLFLAKIVTFIIAIGIIVALIGSIKKQRQQDIQLKLTLLNTHYDDMRDQVYAELLDKKAWKAYVKARKKTEKTEQSNPVEKPRLFVLDFVGDVQASAVDELREQISVILQIAGAKDEVLVRLESGGGYVHSYGLAASQLARLKSANIPLVVAVDKIAASGGYMMACVGQTILAAPFAVIGSVGVVGGVPNVYHLLKKHDIQYEQYTAGEHKRSLTVFAENTDKDRAQFQKELGETHELFKSHIRLMRPTVDVDQIATGETWYGSQALAKCLVDVIQTSDDYLLTRLDTHQILQIELQAPESFLQKLKTRFLGKAVHTPLKANFC